MLSVAPPRRAILRTADGVRLDADIWAPEASGRYPVLLMRQPYGRRIASTLVFAHPSWYAAHGYIVVVQDVRGTGSSEGSFRLFADEAADGAATAAWAADLPGSTGRIGAYGFSYQANTQWLALAGGARLDAAAPAMCGWDMRTDWAWENGAFRLAANLGWGAQMGWVRAMHDGDVEAAAAFQSAARAQPVQEAQRTLPAVMRRLGGLTHYPDWLAHPEPGLFWDSIAPRALLQDCLPAVPMLHIGGWFDQMLMGTLGGFAAMESTGTPQRLVVGPWQHQPWGRRVGAVDFGPAAASPIDRMQLAWFDHHLKGHDLATPAQLTLFDLGTRQWRDFASWPVARPTTWFIDSSGLAAASTEDGVLAEAPGESGTDRFVHDPWRPVPTHGGHAGAPGGMQDRAAIDDRSDVACYTTAPLAAALFLCGSVGAVMPAEADQPSFDLSLVLSMVAPDGRVWNLTQGHARCDGAGPFSVPMRALCATIPAGYRLRLSVAGACFPGYPVNPGSGTAAIDFTARDERIITIGLQRGAEGCRVVLPVVDTG
jgi:putative CocE/NonD family hydrolase